MASLLFLIILGIDFVHVVENQGKDYGDSTNLCPWDMAAKLMTDFGVVRVAWNWLHSQGRGMMSWILSKVSIGTIPRL